MPFCIVQGASLAVLLAVRAEKYQPGMPQRDLRIARLEYFGQLDDHQAGYQVVPGACVNSSMKARSQDGFKASRRASAARRQPGLPACRGWHSSTSLPVRDRTSSTSVRVTRIMDGPAFMSRPLCHIPPRHVERREPRPVDLLADLPHEGVKILTRL